MADNFPLTKKFIRKYGEEVESEIKNRLKGHGKYASGALYKSIRHEIKETQDGDIILLWLMKDYGQYVDKGVNGWNKRQGSTFSFKKKTGGGTGRSPFIESLMKWCKTKGMPKGAAFGIRRSIWKFGISPTNFFTIPTKRRAKFFETQLEKLMLKDIENVITRELK